MGQDESNAGLVRTMAVDAPATSRTVLQIWEWKWNVTRMASSQMLCRRSCIPCPSGH